MNSRAVLILGATGLIGHKLFDHLSRNNQLALWGTTRADTPQATHLPHHLWDTTLCGVDVLNLDTVVQALQRVKPTIIINCAGITKQIIDAEGPLTGIAVNALWPHQLANIAKDAHAQMIHLTTDCVFSGSRGHYSESDQSDATDLYGKTKYLGEVSAPHCLTLRTSFIGHELDGYHGLVEWFMSTHGSTKGYTKAIYSGLPTIELSRLIERYIVGGTRLHGLYHVSSDPISKYDLVQLIAKQYDKQITITPDDSVKIDRSLNSTKFRQEFGFDPKPWHELVKSMYDDYKNSPYYRQYETPAAQTAQSFSVQAHNALEKHE